MYHSEPINVPPSPLEGFYSRLSPLVNPRLPYTYYTYAAPQRSIYPIPTMPTVPTIPTILYYTYSSSTVHPHIIASIAPVFLPSFPYSSLAIPQRSA